MEVGWIVSGSERQSTTTNGKLTRQFKGMYMLFLCGNATCNDGETTTRTKQHFLEMYW